MIKFISFWSQSSEINKVLKTLYIESRYLIDFLNWIFPAYDIIWIEKLMFLSIKLLLNFLFLLLKLWYSLLNLGQRVMMCLRFNIACLFLLNNFLICIVFLIIFCLTLNSMTHLKSFLLLYFLSNLIDKWYCAFLLYKFFEL